MEIPDFDETRRAVGMLNNLCREIKYLHENQGKSWGGGGNHYYAWP